MRPGMPSGRAHASVGRNCERLRRATGAPGRLAPDLLRQQHAAPGRRIAQRAETEPCLLPEENA